MTNNRAVILFLILANFFVTLLFFQTSAKIPEFWFSDGDFNYNWLLLLVSVFIFHKHKLIFEKFSYEVNWLRLIPVFGVALLWSMSIYLNSLGLELSFYILTFCFVTYAIVGKTISSKLLFAIFLMSLSLPLLAVLGKPLQDLTTWVAVYVISQFGFPIFVEGHFIHLSNGMFEVAETCGGLRFFLAALILSCIYAYMHIPNIEGKVVYILILLVFSVCYNWLRVIFIILYGQYVGMDTWVVQDHLSFGWVMFFLGGWAILWIMSRFYPITNQYCADDVSEPQNSTEAAIPERKKYYVFLFSIIAILFFSQSLLTFMKYHQSGVYEYGQIELVKSGWESCYFDDLDWQPKYKGAALSHKACYKNQGEQYYLYSALYGEQTQGSELINQLNKDVGDAYKVAHSTVLEFESDGQYWDVQQFVLRNKNSREDSLVMWRWFKVGAYKTSSSTKAKLLELLRIFSEGPSIVFLIATPVSNRVNISSENLALFVRKHMSSFEGSIKQRVDDN